MESLIKHKFGFLIGRFQMLHVGHEHLINSAYAQCENLLVLVGSAQEQGTVRNPFDVKTRISMMDKLYGYVPNLYVGFLTDLTHENDVTYEWGRYLLNNVRAWAKFYGIRQNLDAMVYGNDEQRNGWFEPKDIEGIEQIQIDRADIPISATMMRGYIGYNDFNQWSKYTNPLLYGYYETLRQQLFEVKS